MPLDALDPRSWPFWGMPGRVLGAVLTVEVVAVLLVARLLVSAGPPGFDALRSAGILLALGIVQAEIAAGVERVRKRIGGPVHVDLCSVWTFAGALLLPPVVAVGLAVMVHTHVWWRSWRPRLPLYRQLFSTATIVLACLAVNAVVAVAKPGASAPLADLGTVVLALLTYSVVNSALVAGAVVMSSEQADFGAAIGEWDDHTLELATLSLGALTAVGLVVNAVLALFTLPAVLLLHRAALVRQLAQVASTDDKTGLLTAGAWHNRAEQELTRQGAASSAVLVVDLDHFKEVNDHHGHLAGDIVLGAVADALQGEVRDQDLVGRFGGEEFVILLAAVDSHRGGDDVLAVAERIRLRVAGLRVEIATPDGPLTVAGLTASIGAALHPGHGDDVSTLMQAADSALYAAKRAGRNTVRLAALPPIDAVSAADLPAQEPPLG
ncbi:MAG TPA: GGDEF domain-containing protein [Pseudonocardia sp.]